MLKAIRLIGTSIKYGHSTLRVGEIFDVERGPELIRYGEARLSPNKI